MQGEGAGRCTEVVFFSTPETHCKFSKRVELYLGGVWGIRKYFTEAVAFQMDFKEYISIDGGWGESLPARSKTEAFGWKAGDCVRFAATLGVFTEE